MMGRRLVAKAPDSNSEDEGSTPSAPATYVLEVNAGFSDKYGIARGTAVELRGL